MTPSVLFVSSHATLGGSELYLERLLDGLGPEWVGGVACLADGPWVARVRERGVRVETLPTGARAGVLAGALRLRALLRRERPGVVHANGVKAALVAVLAAAGTGVPVVWVKHDFSWDGPLARGIAARCRRVVAVSEAVAATFGPRARRRVRIVPNGIPDVAVDRAAARAEVAELTGAADGAPVLTMVGRLDPVKAQLEVIEVLPALLAEHPGLRLLLVGEPDRYRPEYAERVRERIAALGVGEAVTLAGRREDAVALMAGSDLVAVPTMRDERGMGTEGFGLVGVEAMAVGTPVVGYADGALPEVLGACAALVAPGDREALRAEIARLLADGGERERLAACGTARVAARYRLEGMIEAMRLQYAEVAARGRPAHPSGTAPSPGMAQPARTARPSGTLEPAPASGAARRRRLPRVAPGDLWPAALRRFARRRSVVLAFHGVAPRDPAGDPENHLFPPDRFLAEVRRLQAAGFEIVTVAELARRAGGGTPPPGLAALSFDDGMDNNHAVLLPLLRELGVPATVYVISGLVGKPNPWMARETGARMMTEAELHELAAAGVEIGAHTVTHPDLSALDEAACVEEMTGSKQALEALLGTPVQTFAYPYCRYGPAAVAAARRAGFTAAVTCLNQGSWAPLEMRRSMITGRDGPVAFAVKLVGLYDPLFFSAAGRLARWATRRLRRRG